MTDNPFAAPEHGIDRHQVAATNEIEDDFAYVGFWKRVLASIIDNFLLGIAMLPLFFVLVGVMENQSAAQDVHSWLQILLGFAIIILFWHYKQATPGKMVFDARIVDAETFGKPSLGRLILRYVGYIPSTLVFFLGFLWVAFDKKKRGWHDLMAGTVVVTKKPLSERRRTRTRTHVAQKNT